MNLKKATIILLGCSFIFLMIALSNDNHTEEYLTPIDFSSLKTKIENKDDFILYISKASCTYCNLFQPKLQKIINEKKITVYKIDTATLTDDEYDEFISYVAETGTPTVMFFYDGIESGSGNRINGNVESKVILSRLKANNYIKD